MKNIIMELSGHAQKTITFGRYGKNYEVKPLYETICKLDYSIDIFELTGIKPLSDDVIAKQIELLANGFNNIPDKLLAKHLKAQAKKRG